VGREFILQLQKLFSVPLPRGRRTPWETRIGGVNVFGGGLALYNAKGVLIGDAGRITPQTGVNLPEPSFPELSLTFPYE
jgi:hypothetical protein